ncbi:MAG: transposase [Chloroflexia bacterium]
MRNRAPSVKVGTIIGSFKSAPTKRINELHNKPGEPVWQRNYYEHVIRNEHELNRIREYIYWNPAKWAQDENNSLNW